MDGLSARAVIRGKGATKNLRKLIFYEVVFGLLISEEIKLEFKHYTLATDAEGFLKSSFGALGQKDTVSSGRYHLRPSLVNRDRDIF